VVLAESALDRALEATNRVFEDLADRTPYVFELLGMRNLSAFVGAVFARELQTASEELLLLNPHQDGYPDLLLLDAVGLKALNMVKAADQMRGKEPFSPFPTGGLEIKATCGDVPSERMLAARGLQKPQIGDTRVGLVTGINWKAHHRDTNNLMGLIWDFWEGLPAVMVVSYSNRLNPEDWGKIVQPRAGGGRTTSVSIMAKSGVVKMLSNAVRVVKLPAYAELVAKTSGR
jgi:hypothetical protein